MIKADPRTIGLIITIALFFASITVNVALAASGTQIQDLKETTKENAKDIGEINVSIGEINTNVRNQSEDIREIKEDLRLHFQGKD